MIKGCQRRVIIVKGDEESIFESACFVLKNSPKYQSLGESDMIAEADKIIRESERSKDKKQEIKAQKEKKNYKKLIIPFSVGALVGSLLGLVWLFL